MKRLYTQFLYRALAAILVFSTFCTGGNAQIFPANFEPCGNDLSTPAGPATDGNPAAPTDPYTLYSGNEYRQIPDLKIWGGVGEHQLSWTRWGNSRFVGGQNYFGDAHSWRHGY